ncbi:DUF6286 domain-containing protein [Actinokineospora bangkokensis]|uniref:DUF6286 domain-containing protein n=1 Tax=Actinokineospora bangkokensis TaxID=1193682 RepID=A0A1Q9LII6_9PSEU|nr:DUF6286 domain-containing protein [Actinokineospora bangkokensis]OLR91836.1 hypothetical protein BJP25_23645 [Actinokineospora bangkokensis]
MKRHPRRSAPAALTALVVLAACVLVAVVAIQMLLGQAPWVRYETVAGALHGTRWTDLAPAIAGGAFAVVGLVLVLAAVLPGKPVVLPLQGTPDSGASRHSYRSTLRIAAERVDGVAKAKVSLSRKRVTVRVRTHRISTEGMADAVRTAVEHRLDQIDPAVRPTVAVTAHAERSAP